MDEDGDAHGPPTIWGLDLSPTTVAAIYRGVDNDHSVAMLEPLGLTIRIINALEGSQYRILYLKDLLNRTPEDLRKINTIGGVGLKIIYNCLANYEKLPCPNKKN